MAIQAKFLPVENHSIDIDHYFIHLNDVPSTFSGSADKYVKINSTASGLEFSSISHSTLGGIGDDDHLQYVPTNGSRGFTSTVSGVYPAQDYDLSTKQYIDDNLYFTSLQDTPSVYSGTQLYARVKADLSGLELDYADATYIKGTAVDETDIAEGYILRYDAIEDHLHYEGIGSIIDEFGVFGSHASTQVEEGMVSTTSTTYQENLTTTISGLPYGIYRVGWYYQWQINNSNFKFFGRIQVNDTDTIMEHIERPSSAGSWTSQTGFYYLTISGTIQIDLDYASESSGKTASIRTTRIEFWRVT